jgi:hypothetical protein
MQVWNSQYALFIAFGVNSFYMLVSYENIYSSCIQQQQPVSPYWD